MRDKLRPLVELGKHLGMFKGQELAAAQPADHGKPLDDLEELYGNAPMPPPPPSGKVP